MNGKHIAKLGLTGADIGLALAVATLREDAGASRDEILGELAGVQASPAEYGEGIYGALSASLLAQQAREDAHAGLHVADTLRPEALSYRVWGAELIKPGALAQMDTAMRLPIARAGALMPDAHPRGLRPTHRRGAGNPGRGHSLRRGRCDGVVALSE